MKHTFLLAAIFIIGLLVMACAPKGAPVEKPAAPETIAPEVITAGKEAWEIEWEKVLNDARKEGTLVISSGRPEVMRNIIANAFQKKYGPKIQWMVGGSAQTSARLIAERRVGLYTNDISIDGGNTLISRYKHAGFLEPLPPSIILPEIKDPSAWFNGKLPFLDNEGLYILSLTLYPQSPIGYNTDLVNPEEISSYQKLLDPKWKGKFISNDFTLVGGGLKWFSAMTEKDFGPILGIDYMRALAKQEPLIIRDARLAIEWLMRGKYPYGMNIPMEATLLEYRRQGFRVPIEMFTPKEGGYLTTGGHNLSFFKNAPHPNAAKVFINWVFSREGSVVYTKASIRPSGRIDIGDPRQIEPEVIMREPGMKYAMPDQEIYLLKTDEYADKAIEIFGHLLK